MRRRSLRNVTAKGRGVGGSRKTGGLRGRAWCVVVCGNRRFVVIEVCVRGFEIDFEEDGGLVNSSSSRNVSFSSDNKDNYCFFFSLLLSL